MRKSISITIVILLTVSILGCLNGPSPPGVDRPSIAVDYNEETDESIIYIRGVELTRFDNITLYLDEKEITIYNAFSLEERTNRSEFYIDVYASRDDKVYNYNASFEVRPEIEDEKNDEPIIFKVTYYDGEQEYKRENDLPFSASLDLWEEDQK